MVAFRTPASHPVLHPRRDGFAARRWHGRASRQLFHARPKPTAGILVAFFLASTSGGALAATEVVRIAGDVFEIAYSGATDEASIKEFVPAGETIQNWSTMVAVRHFKNPQSPEEYIRNVAAEYRKTMPHMRFAMSQLEQDDAWDIDFIIYNRGQQTGGFVEWNYFRAERREAGEGVLVNQYVARRPFSRSIEEVFDTWDIASLRKQMLPILKQAEFRIVGGETSEAQVSR